jgi:hypothetical protein
LALLEKYLAYFQRAGRVGIDTDERAGRYRNQPGEKENICHLQVGNFGYNTLDFKFLWARAHINICIALALEARLKTSLPFTPNWHRFDLLYTVYCSIFKKVFVITQYGPLSHPKRGLKYTCMILKYYLSLEATM